MELGLGHSSFAVVGSRVYTLGYDAEKKLDTVFCLDVETGEPVWTHSYESEIWDIAHDGGTLTTPTVLGDVVYTSNREGKVYCLDAATGDVRWSRDLRAELELEPPKWGFSASPLVVDGRVLMNVDRVVALDAATGEDVWATERKYGIAYSTPASFELEGRSLLASLSGDGLVVLDREDGTEVAWQEWIKPPQIYPMTPVVIGDRIFISGGYDRGCAMLRLEGDTLTELWAGRMMRNKMSGCVLWQDHLIGFDESMLKCIDLDGKMKWRVRGLGTGSMTIAGGRLVILDGKGQVIVAEANPEEYVELSKRSVFDDGTSWSSPVMSGGRIYCRTSKGAMACLDHRGSGEVLAIAGGAAAELPTAEALVARHLDALRGGEPTKAITSIRMKGAGDSLRNTVNKGVVELDWKAGEAFSWKDDAGFQIAYDAEIGWSLGTMDGPTLLKDEALDAAHEAGDLARILDPSMGYREMKTRSRTTFDNRACYAVAATTKEGHERTVFFDAETGLFAGHDGEGVSMWTLAGYRDFDGVTLPTVWAFYESETGERSAATFDDVTLNPPADESRFARPEVIGMFLRTPEEIARDEERLRELHADVLGAWRSEDAPKDAPDTEFYVEEGFLWIRGGGGAPARLTEPDANGTVRILGVEYVSFARVLGESGEIEKIEVRYGPDLEATLFRKP
ncbi:MAG: PQQ-binding-like beta-propeller repeat protein [Planctomycetota bacterium]